MSPRRAALLTRRRAPSRALFLLVLGYTTTCAISASATPRLRKLEPAPRRAGLALLDASLRATPGASRRPALVLRDGRVETRRAPLPALLAESNEEGVAQLELARPLALLLHEDVLAVGLAPLTTERPKGLPTGEGVLIGIVDTGIDWAHPDLLDEQGRSRVAWLLDLSLSERVGAHPAITNFGGALWDNAEIQEALDGERLLPSQDRVGHGTHIASIAGGRDQLGVLGADGIAPSARFIVVKATRDDSTALNEADVLDGLRFIVERAQAEEAPVVVNLSLGAHIGPHDGTSLFERAIADLFTDAPGRVLVVSAGNSGADAIHASAALPGDAAPIQLGFEIPASTRTGAAPRLVVIEVWYEHDPTHPVSLELLAPDGRALPETGAGAAADDLDPLRGSLALVHAPPGDATPGMASALVTIQEPEAKALEPGPWRLLVRGGRGRMDAWIASSNPLGATFNDHVDPQGVLTVPGTVDGAVTVGAYVASNTWEDRQGAAQRGALPIGSIAPFSSQGPSRDGRPKPDVLGPGYTVAAALSADADPDTSAASIFAPLLRAGLDPILPGERHAVASGTSAATPFVTGTVALLLERDPTLDAAEVVDLLRATATPPPLGPPWRYNPQAGFGVLNVSNALAAGDAVADDRRVSPDKSEVGLTFERLDEGERTLVLIVPKNSAGLPAPFERVQLRLTGLVGAPHILAAERLGPYVAAIPIEPGGAAGLGVVHIDVDGVELRATPLLQIGAPHAAVADRSALCTITRATPGGAPLLLPALALLALLARRRRQPL